MTSPGLRLHRERWRNRRRETAEAQIHR